MLYRRFSYWIGIIRTRWKYSCWSLLPLWSRLFQLYNTANLYKLYIIVMVVTWRLQVCSHNKNRLYDLGSDDDCLPHTHRLHYILKDTRCCAIAIINHHIPQSLCENRLFSLLVKVNQLPQMASSIRENNSFDEKQSWFCINRSMIFKPVRIKACCGIL